MYCAVKYLLKIALMSIPDDGMSTKISDTPRKKKRAANRLLSFVNLSIMRSQHCDPRGGYSFRFLIS